MDDEELARWGAFGRMIHPGLGMMMPDTSADMVKLWNAFGALEEKVRNEQRQP